MRSVAMLVVAAVASSVACGGEIDRNAAAAANSASVYSEPGSGAGAPPSGPPRACLGAEREVIVKGVGLNIGWLALDATHVYFGSIVDERLRRVAKGGGPVETLSTVSSIDLAVTLTETSLVFADNGGIVRLPKAGGAPAREAYESREAVGAIAADDERLAALTSGQLLRCKRSQPCTQENVGGSFGTKIAMDADWIYYRRPKGAAYALVRTARDSITGIHEEIVDGISEAGGTVLLDDRIYFTSSTSIDATLASVPKTPGHSPTTLAQLRDDYGLLFAVDARWVYFTASAAKTIRAASRTGGAPPADLATSTSPSFIASDGDHVYWYDRADGVVYRVRAPC